MEGKKYPDLYIVTIQSMFFIGMDVIRKKPVVTDRNPNLEGLVDIHRCIYLPSAHEKNQNLPDYLTQVSLMISNSIYVPAFFDPKISFKLFFPQKITFIELPDASTYAPGIAPGLFFITPKLMGCNIFVAHDVGLHKYWVVRISAKNPHKPPDLNRIPSKDKITKVCIMQAEKCSTISTLSMEMLKRSANLIKKNILLCILAKMHFYTYS